MYIFICLCTQMNLQILLNKFLLCVWQMKKKNKHLLFKSRWLYYDGDNDNTIIEEGNIYPNSGNPQAGRIYNSGGISPCLDTCTGGNRMPKIVEEPLIAASRGRYQEDGSTEQQLEINETGCSNTLTTVQKDNLVVENRLRIRRLTPKECWRLMAFTDEEFDKVQATGISNTQLYKMAGNSIVVNCLVALFFNLLLKK